MSIISTSNGQLKQMSRTEILSDHMFKTAICSTKLRQSSDHNICPVKYLKLVNLN